MYSFFTLQTINFTEPFYAPPVVLVTPKHSDNNNKSHLSMSRCNAVTAWVEVRYHLSDIWHTPSLFGLCVS